MARYIQNVTLNKPDDFVSFIMNDFLQKNSFVMSDWKGEAAYRTGDPMFEGYKYLKWSYANGVLHLEAWLKGTFGGEWDLEGFVAIAQKKPYKNNLEQLIALLQQDIPQPVPGAASPGGAAPATNVIPVQTTDNSGAAKTSLIFGILSLALCWSPLLCLLVSIFAFTFSRTGKYSSKAGMAKAGKICAIVGLSITAALYLLNVILAAILAMA